MEGNLLRVGSGNDFLQQVILNRWSVSEHGPFATVKVTLFNLIDHRSLRVVAYIRYNGHIRGQFAAYHLSPAQSNLFLYCIDDVQGKGQFLFVFLKEPCHFGNHKAAHAVIECAAYVVTVVEGHKLIFEGHDTAHMNAQFFNLFLRHTTAVEEDVFHAGALFLARCKVAGVNGRPSKYGAHRAFVRVNDNALARCNHMVAATVAAQVDKTLVGDVVYKPADLIGVGLDGHFVLLTRIDHRGYGAVSVYFIAVNVWFEVVDPGLLSQNFKTRRGGVVDVLFEKFERSRSQQRFLCHFFFGQN